MRWKMLLIINQFVTREISSLEGCDINMDLSREVCELQYDLEVLHASNSKLQNEL